MKAVKMRPLGRGVIPAATDEDAAVRRTALWVGLPAFFAVGGIVTWFALIPGRSGAG